MGKCIIFCAAAFDALVQPVEKEDFVIAADGGLEHTAKLGLEPNEILGDFDSLGYTPDDARVFPVEKDDTDAMLALSMAFSSMDDIEPLVSAMKKMCFTPSFFMAIAQSGA